MIHSLYKQTANRWLHGCLFAVLLLMTLLLSRQASAQKDYTIETLPNVRLSNRFNHVSNPDGILRADDVARMNQLLQLVEDSLGIEVAVVAVKSIGENIPRSFATELFKHWGLGKKGEDNGLLIQLVTDPAQRSIVFETGYGIEGILPDAKCYRLQQQYMIPAMKQGDYSTGMLKGVQAVSHYLMASDYERASNQGGKRQGAFTDEGDLFLWMPMVMGVLVLGVVFMVNYMKRRPKVCPRCGQKSLQYRGRQTLMNPTYHSEGLAEEVFRCSQCGYQTRKRFTLDRLHRRSGGGGPIIFGGGGGFGGFSGGGGSWGGGSSGGGGAESRF